MVRIPIHVVITSIVKDYWIIYDYIEMQLTGWEWGCRGQVAVRTPSGGWRWCWGVWRNCWCFILVRPCFVLNQIQLLIITVSAVGHLKLPVACTTMSCSGSTIVWLPSRLTPTTRWGAGMRVGCPTWDCRSPRWPLLPTTTFVRALRAATTDCGHSIACCSPLTSLRINASTSDYGNWIGHQNDV